MSSRNIALLSLLSVAIIILIIAPVSEAARQQQGSHELYPLVKRQLPEKPTLVTIHSEASIDRVVVKFRDSYSVRLQAGKLVDRKGGSIAGIEPIVYEYVTFSNLKRLFRVAPEDRLEQARTVLQLQSKHELADLNNYYEITVTSVAEAEALVNRLNKLDIVEIAYVEPSPEPAGDIDPPTPDYQPNQDYREAAPSGIDADYANTLPGGDGAGVTIVDIEGAWQETHEDLDKAVGGLIGGVELNDISWRNHGTAVIGELIAGDNGYGVTGICPVADIRMVSIGSISTAAALYIAIDSLEAGDVILIELHAPGPHYDFQSRPDQLGYVCMEYWQANYDAIQYAWAKGITVVEAAGNGAENFDDTTIYGALFDTTYRNSHAIIVGAGYPAASLNSRWRQDFSNYGERVNLQGYGSGVYTTGYGGLFDGNGDENQYYTAAFSGTSSASPIVTGAVACLQGYYKATYGGVPMTSDQIRDVLVATGSPQMGDTTEHIGPLPDLQAAIATLTGPPSLYVNPLFLDTTLDEGSQAIMNIVLHNRSTTEAFDFQINDNDSLTKRVGENWLIATPNTGTIAPSDSITIAVTVDASVIPDRVEKYTGVLEISWGLTGGVLDSLLYVPVFLEVPCFDTTYIAVSSVDTGGPSYNWISAKDIGFKVPSSLFYSSGTNPLDDGTTGPWDINFSFPFYDTSYTEVFIGVNGAISFTDSNLNIGGFYSGLEVPGAPFETFIAPFWADLIFDEGTVADGGIYIYQSPANDMLVIEWYHPANFNQFGDTTMNFEIILTRFGDIIYQYRDVGVSGLELTALVGISEFECHALSYYNNGVPPEHVISNNEAVLFHNTGYQWAQAGDMDGEPGLNVADLTYLVAFLFSGGPDPIPYEAGNIDCLDDINVADLTYLVAYLFSGGPEPCYYML